jgi:hypothetical protein
MDRMSDLTVTATVDGDVPVAAKFWCGKIFEEFTGVALDVKTSTELEQCARELSNNDWMIPHAIKFVIEHPLFYNNLGNKIRWRRDVLFGAEWDIGFNDVSMGMRRAMIGAVGQSPFGMPDVGGYERTIQLNYMMNLHYHLWQELYWGFYHQSKNEYFETEQTLQQYLGGFLKPDGEHYAYSALRCGGNTVLVANEGKAIGQSHEISNDELWNGKFVEIAADAKCASQHDGDTKVLGNFQTVEECAAAVQWPCGDGFSFHADGTCTCMISEWSWPDWCNKPEESITPHNCQTNSKCETTEPQSGAKAYQWTGKGNGSGHRNGIFRDTMRVGIDNPCLFVA